jgi:cbb3-type cytochrome c oxidase subunit II
MTKENKSGLTHRKLEGWPLVFTILVTISILVGGAIEFIPLATIKSQIPTIASVTPYSPLELTGRDIYIREGCNNCHSQMVRPFRDEIERYGEYNKPGESIYDRPFLWGSKRTGPDLWRVGGKYPDLWHVRHMQNPRLVSPKSIMPNYDWLLTWELDLDNLPTKLSRLRMLGTPYTNEDIDTAVADAQAQAREIASRVETDGGPTGLADKEIVAIVAYLQRLGTDLEKSGS